MADVPYQQAAQVEQAERELENAEALGLTDRVEAAKKTLEALGVKKEAKKAAAEERKAAADKSDEDEPKKSPPEGRSAKSQETVSGPRKSSN